MYNLLARAGVCDPSVEKATIGGRKRFILRINRAAAQESPMTIRYFTKDDIPLLWNWLNKPHVKSRWEVPASFSDFKATKLRHLSLHQDNEFIIRSNNNPIAFFQYFWGNQDITNAVGLKTEATSKILILGYFVAEETHFNDEAIVMALKSFIDKAFTETDTECILSASSMDEPYHFKNLSRAGFIILESFDTHDQRSIIMKFDKKMYKGHNQHQE